jgi:hypothetical protein
VPFQRLLLEAFWSGSASPHASLHRAEGMLDGLATLAHGLWICIKGAAAQLRADAHAPIVESAALALSCTAI